VTRCANKEESLNQSALASFTPELWALLFQNCEDTSEEATRNIIAECLGKMSSFQPSSYLPDLQV